MTKADMFMKMDIEHILAYGYKDINTRPKYEDGTHAHKYSVKQDLRKKDLDKGELHICK